MGFYAPAQIVRDAREHDIEVLPVDINHSDWDNILESDCADGRFSVRLGFRQVSGLSEDVMKPFVAKRQQHFVSPYEAHRIGGLSVAVLEKLASADAMRSMQVDRRQALWAIRGMINSVGQEAGKAAQMPLFDAAKITSLGDDPNVNLPQMKLREHVVADYQTHRLSLKAHPMRILRPIYDQGIKSMDPKHAWRKPQRTLTARDLFKTNHGTWVTIAGVVLVRQKPGTAKGVVFITLEDETGTVNIVIWSKLMAKYRRTIMAARLMAVRGQVQREGDVIHVVAQELIDRTSDLDTLSDDRFELQFANADHVTSPLPESLSMKRKVERMAARGETAQSDIAVMIEPETRASKPTNTNIIPLSRADEVKNPQDDRRGLPVHIPEEHRPQKPVIVNQGRHPRNVRIIPKSRDFH